MRNLVLLFDGVRMVAHFAKIFFADENRSKFKLTYSSCWGLHIYLPVTHRCVCVCVRVFVCGFTMNIEYIFFQPQNSLSTFRLPAFDTSHGNVIVVPATNFNVSERVTNIGSGFPRFCSAAVAETKQKDRK